MKNLSMKERLLKDLTDFFASLPDDAGQGESGENEEAGDEGSVEMMISDEHEAMEKKPGMKGC